MSGPKSAAPTRFARPSCILTIGLPFVEVIPYAQAVIAVAPDRVIWGTDWPHSNNFAPGHTPNDGDLVDLLAAFAPDESIRRKILVDNPAALYGFN